MTWDKALFPKPEELQNNIASRGRKMVTIVDPHIKRDPGYPIFKAAEDKGYYVKNKDGKDYDGCAHNGSTLGERRGTELSVSCVLHRRQIPACSSSMSYRLPVGVDADAHSSQQR